WITFTAFALTLAACAPLYDGTFGPTTSPPDESPAADLADARVRWASFGAGDYAYQFTNDCGECDPTARSPRRIAVLDGRVLAVHGTDLLTVEQVFESIEQALDAGRRVEVSYDPETGLPRDVQIDMDMRPVDGGTHWTLDMLTSFSPVDSAEGLRAARLLWAAQGLNNYRFLMKVECDCPENGTFDVKVVDDQVVDVIPLDPEAEASSVTPVTMNRTFDDLEEWFTDRKTLIDEGILDLDVRVDPVMGYPRWMHMDAAFPDEYSARPFTAVVTMELVGPLDPTEFSPKPDPDDLAAIQLARSLWKASGITDYRYTLTVHCECPQEHTGPFEITVHGQRITSATWNGNPLGPDQGTTYAVDEVFTMIDHAVQDGIDVDVTYDPVLGHPQLVIINVEAVAVDGGLAFTIDNLIPLDRQGGLAGQAVAGPTCPVQKDPAAGVCADRPVDGAVLLVFSFGDTEVARITTNQNGYFRISLDPGYYRIEPQPVAGLLGTAVPFELEVIAGITDEVTITYDTGIR
ncbi:MAG: carboxypeptidase-like regulatory domain-containing protein, partial [Acidimicrobiia bacterium]|nr:carboxypeptidase-like regulatory domain-containing protein [Acidimicrobiia bacterium]